MSKADGKAVLSKLSNRQPTQLGQIRNNRSLISGLTFCKLKSMFVFIFCCRYLYILKIDICKFDIRNVTFSSKCYKTMFKIKTNDINSRNYSIV